MLPYSYRVCYDLEFNNNKCQIQRRSSDFQTIHASLIGSSVTSYHILTPDDGGGGIFYPNNKLCTYSFPPRQFNHLYIYLYHIPPDIEESTTPLRCLDSLQYEHCLNGASPQHIITCDSHMLQGRYVLGDISMAFRSNSDVQHKGADFFALEHSIEVNYIIR